MRWKGFECWLHPPTFDLATNIQTSASPPPQRAPHHKEPPAAMSNPNNANDEATIRAILAAPISITNKALQQQYGIKDIKTVANIRLGRTCKNIAPELPRLASIPPNYAHRQTCKMCRLFEPTPCRIDRIDSEKPIKRLGHCTVGIPECNDSLHFARECPSFYPLG